MLHESNNRSARSERIETATGTEPAQRDVNTDQSDCAIARADGHTVTVSADIARQQQQHNYMPMAYAKFADVPESKRMRCRLALGRAALCWLQRKLPNAMERMPIVMGFWALTVTIGTCNDILCHTFREFVPRRDIFCVVVSSSLRRCVAYSERLSSACTICISSGKQIYATARHTMRKSRCP